MLKSDKSFVKKTPLAVPFIYLKGRLTKPRTQNDEAQILSALIGRYPIPKLFVEFGFGGWEFNCAPLAYDWDGLLLDGDAYNVKIARTILPSRVRALHAWLTLETLGPIREFVAGRDLGVLSVDIDGNDYWLLEDLIDLKPAMIIAEYNTTFGLRSITVPYDPDFDYTSHDGWLYHGASLPALAKLTGRHGYSLIAVGSTGINAFFVRNDLLGPSDRPLDPIEAWREQPFVDGSRYVDRWKRIEHLPFVTI